MSERRVCRVLTEDIIALARQYGRYGYRQGTALLRDAGWRANRKRVERIWRREGLKNWFSCRLVHGRISDDQIGLLELGGLPGGRKRVGQIEVVGGDAVEMRVHLQQTILPPVAWKSPQNQANERPW